MTGRSVQMQGKKQGRKRPPTATAWKPGQSGNPGGKQPGTRNRATVLAQALIDNDAEQVVGQVIKAALNGDLAAAKLILERVVPPIRERPLSLSLPEDLSTAAGVSEAGASV